MQYNAKTRAAIGLDFWLRRSPPPLEISGNVHKIHMTIIKLLTSDNQRLFCNSDSEVVIAWDLSTSDAEEKFYFSYSRFWWGYQKFNL